MNAVVLQIATYRSMLRFVPDKLFIAIWLVLIMCVTASAATSSPGQTDLTELDLSFIRWSITPKIVPESITIGFGQGSSVHPYQIVRSPNDSMSFSCTYDNNIEYQHTVSWSVAVERIQDELVVNINSYRLDEESPFDIQVGCQIVVTAGTFDNRKHDKIIYIKANADSNFTQEFRYKILPDSKLSDAAEYVGMEYLNQARLDIPPPPKIPIYDYELSALSCVYVPGIRNQRLKFNTIAVSLRFYDKALWGISMRNLRVGCELVNCAVAFSGDEVHNYMLSPQFISENARQDTFVLSRGSLNWCRFLLDFGIYSTKRHFGSLRFALNPFDEYDFRGIIPIDTVEDSNGDESVEYDEKTLSFMAFETGILWETSIWLVPLRLGIIDLWNLKLSLLATHVESFGSRAKIIQIDHPENVHAFPPKSGFRFEIGLSTSLIFDALYDIPRQDRRKWERRVSKRAMALEYFDAQPCKIEFSSIPEVDDNSSLIPNKALDAGETIEIQFEVENKGPGPALDPALNVDLSSPMLRLSAKQFSSNRLMPGEKRRGSVQVAASKDIDIDKAFVNIGIQEKRGFHSARKVVSMDVNSWKPSNINIDNLRWYDGNVGKSEGNGDGIIQNGETLLCELDLHNEGFGPAVDCAVTVNCSKPLVTVKQPLINLGTIHPSQSLIARFLVSIDREFKDPWFELDIVVREARSPKNCVSKTQSLLVKFVSPRIRAVVTALEQLSNGESSKLMVKVTNYSKVEARDVFVNLEADDLSIAPSALFIGNLGGAKSNKEVTEFADLYVPYGYSSPRAELRISIRQKGFPEERLTEDIPVHITQPSLNVFTSPVSCNAAVLGLDYIWQFDVHNIGDRAATNCVVSILSSHEIADKESIIDIGTLSTGSRYQGRLHLPIIPRSALENSDSLRLRVKVSQDSFPSICKEISIPFAKDTGDTVFFSQFRYTEKASSMQLLDGEYVVPDRDPEVDVSVVPFDGPVRESAYGLVIANYRYDNVPTVENALHDASCVTEYFSHIFGIPNSQLLDEYQSETTSELLTAFSKDLPNIIRNPKRTDLYVYYCGHGIPFEREDDSYISGALIGKDYSPANSYAYTIPLEDLFAAIDSLHVRTATVFIESCFSGLSQNPISPLLPRLENVGFKCEYKLPKNVRLFVAAGKDQFACVDNETGHGIFTEHLLKGLNGFADSNRDKIITCGEMISYLKEEVGSRAISSLHRIQTPEYYGDSHAELIRLPEVLIGSFPNK